MVVYDAAAVLRRQREREEEANSASDDEFETALAIPSDIKLDWSTNSRTSAHLELTMGRIGFGMAATLNHDFMVDNQNQRYWADFYGNSFMSHFRETPTLGALSSWDASHNTIEGASIAGAVGRISHAMPPTNHMDDAWIGVHHEDDYQMNNSSDITKVYHDVLLQNGIGNIPDLAPLTIQNKRKLDLIGMVTFAATPPNAQSAIPSMKNKRNVGEFMGQYPNLQWNPNCWLHQIEHRNMRNRPGTLKFMDLFVKTPACLYNPTGAARRMEDIHTLTTTRPNMMSRDWIRLNLYNQYAWVVLQYENHPLTVHAKRMGFRPLYLFKNLYRSDNTGYAGERLNSCDMDGKTYILLLGYIKVFDAPYQDNCICISVTKNGRPLIAGDTQGFHGNVDMN